jgi:hypothetical protein
VGQIVDRALELSRATLVRDLREILLRVAPSAGEGPSLSRASLGVQGADITTDSGANLAGCHA